MAQHSISEARSLRATVSQALSLRTIVRVRLITALIITLSSLICFLGTSWDIQWHHFVGRDRTLIPPHEMMLLGIILSGIAALVLVVIETIWARQKRSSAQQVTPFAGLFAAPLGAYIAGYAALNAAVAFPLDSYWHSLYGIDVALWAPFHVMIISGMALTALGAAYICASTANLASHIQAFRLQRVAYLGMMVALASTLSLFTLLTIDGLDAGNMIQLGLGAISFFPFLIGLLVSCVLVTAASILPWRWAATSVFGVMALCLIIDQLAIPPALTLLMQAEQLTVLYANTPAPPVSLVTVSWPLLTMIAAILIDVVMHSAKKRSWSPRQLLIRLALAAFVCTIPVMIADPTVGLELLGTVGAVGTIPTFAIGCLGICGGIVLGQSIAKTMQTLEG